jgi:hypothetical protein
MAWGMVLSTSLSIVEDLFRALCAVPSQKKCPKFVSKLARLNTTFFSLEEVRTEIR